MCISGLLNWRSVQGLIDNRESLVDSSALEILTIEIDHKNVFHLQDKLVSKFSWKLKRFEVQIWREGIYEGFDWENLRDLKIHRGKSQFVLESLMNAMKMGNLRKLSLRLNGRGKYLDGLVGLTKKFPELTDLELKFKGEGNLTQLCKERLPVGLVGFSILTSSEINSEWEETISYDFLVYFPYLNRLTIKHCHRISRSIRGAGLSTEIIGQNDSKDGTVILNIGKYLARQRDNNRDKYDLKRKIYGKSNIWGYLPFMKVFTVYSGSFADKHRNVLRRHVYEKYWRKSNESVLEL